MTDTADTAAMPTGTVPIPPPFPFTALSGQPELRLALLLAAIDPALGGVLIEGPRGSAKSTAARALAELLPGAPFVSLPLGASLEHLVGSLDLGQALAGHALRFRPGLLARADGGILYVDEVNLLPDPLVDALLDSAASGINIVERDGISHHHRARFTLIGTMNPDEGTLRPQLLDRFGLSVVLRPIIDPRERQAIVRQRLAFDADPQAFRERHAAGQSALVARLGRARERLASGPLDADDAVHGQVATLCLAAGVEGLRADLAMLRAARALAALEGRDSPSSADVERVSPLVLGHRTPSRDAGPSTAIPPQAAETSRASFDGRPSPPAVESERSHASQDELLDTTPPGSRQDDRQRNSEDSQQDDWGELLPEPAGTRPVKLATRPESPGAPAGKKR